MNWSPEAWSAVADWLMAIAAVGAAITAWHGLSTWRHQERWKEDRQIARDISREVVRYKDAVAAACRQYISVAIFGEETLEAASEAETRRRFSEVAERRAAITAHLIEAKILWGELIPTETISRLAKHETKLRVSRDEFRALSAGHPRSLAPDERKIRMKRLEELAAVVFSSENDQFAQELDRLLGEISGPVAKKLGRPT